MSLIRKQARLLHTSGQVIRTTPDHLILGFAAGTPIRTADGSVLIEQIQPGDLIQMQPDDCEDIRRCIARG